MQEWVVAITFSSRGFALLRAQSHHYANLSESIKTLAAGNYPRSTTLPAEAFQDGSLTVGFGAPSLNSFEEEALIAFRVSTTILAADIISA